MRLYVICFFCLYACSANAKIYLDVNQGIVAPIPVGFLGFLNDDLNIVSIIKNDLLASGAFTEVKVDQPPSFHNFMMHPDFHPWLLARTLVTGEVIKHNQILIIKLFVYDIAQKKLIHVLVKQGPISHIRHLAHQISDIVYQDLTGFPGYFDTKIAFISSLKNPRLAIMDFDGYNFQYLTNGKQDVLSPRFSPDGRLISYVQYDSGIPRIHVMNYLTRKEIRVIGPMYGATFAPRWSYDGKKLYFSFSWHGNSDIYVTNLRSQVVHRLTNDGSIDVSPSPSPDQKWIVYSSDKSGRSQLYVMDSHGKNTRRITFGSGSYFTPVWSPDGRWIAFTCYWKKSYFIGIMDPSGRKVSFLSSGYYQENPSWDSSGHMLLFPRERSRDDSEQDSLYVMDISGYNLHVIKTPDVAFDPSWSPPWKDYDGQNKK